MKISVIIPCHNAAAYVGQAIGCVLEQNRTPDEIIVVDDASNDNSLAVAESFGHKVRVLSARNGNAADTRAHGYAHASGDAVLFLDADDVLRPDTIQHLGRTVEQHSGSVAACPWARLECVSGRWVEQPQSCPPRRAGEDPLRAWLRGWYHPTSSVMWSRSAYERTGGWDPRGRSNDDGYLMMRALAREIPFHLTDGGLMYYRRLPEEAATVSGTRFTEVGIEARIFVLEDIARILKEQNRLTWAYRRVLDDALKSIASDCNPPLENWIDVCDRKRSEFGKKRWERALPGFSLQGMIQRGLRRKTRKQTTAPETAGAEEVRYGLSAAQRAAANTPPPLNSQ